MMLKTLLDDIRAQHDPITEAFRMDQRTYRDLIADENFQFGYEAEFNYVIRFDDDFDPVDRHVSVEEEYTDTFYDVLSKLERAIGQPIIPNPSADKNKETGKFYLDIETSIDDLYSDFDDSADSLSVYNDEIVMGLELVSPPFVLDEFLDYLYQTMEWIDVNGETADNTGLHINVSYRGGDPSKFDMLKVLLLLGEDSLVQQFNRMDNPDTRSHMFELMQQASYMSFNKFVADTQGVSELIKMFQSMINKNKHFTMNYGKFLQQGYMEFRITGGYQYTKKFTEVRRVALQYALLMKAGYDPQLYRREYLLKLYKLIRSITGADNAQTTPSRYPGPNKGPRGISKTNHTDVIPQYSK